MPSFDIKAEVVCIVPELAGFKRLIGKDIQEPQRSVLAIRDIEPVSVRQIQDALWFAQVGDGMNSLPPSRYRSPRWCCSLVRRQTAGRYLRRVTCGLCGPECREVEWF